MNPQTATLLLLLAGDLTRGERVSLEEYARKRDISLVAPAPTPGAKYPAYRQELVLDLEGRLDEARTLASSLDAERALELLAAIGRDVTAHPELPQAAWLLAEHHRIAAEVRKAAADGSADIGALTRAANTLEGPRAAAFGAEAAAEQPAPLVSVRIADLDARDVLELDGVGGGAERTLSPGTHQVRVLRGGELVFAGWVPLGTSAEVTLGVRPLAACSMEDLGAITVQGDRVQARPGVRCPRFVVARRSGGQLWAADCARSACTAFTPLTTTKLEASSGLAPWATAAIAGASALAAITLLAWATGSFEREPADEKTVFVYGGVK